MEVKKRGDKKVIKGEELGDDDFVPEIIQKGVDIKIGLDIAWISLEKIAQRIVLITGDSDFVPAMKFARRNGIQVMLATLGHGVKEELKNNADFLVEVGLKEIMK